MSIPTRISLDKLNQLIVSFLLSGGDQKPVSVKDASGRTEISSDLAGRQTKFLTLAGFLVKEGQNFKLTDEGAEYAKYLDWGQEKPAQERLAKILKQFELAEKVTQFIRVAGPVPRGEVVKRVGILSDSPSTKHYRTGADTFLNLLLFAELAQEDEKGQLTVAGQKERHVVSPPSMKQFSLLEPKARATEGLAVTIVLNLDSQIDVKQLRRLIRVLKEELLEAQTVKPSRRD